MTLEYMYEIQVNRGKGWDAYPDPLYDNYDRAIKKVSYLRTYAEEHQTGSQFQIVKLDKQGVEKHNNDWKRWCSMID